MKKSLLFSVAAILFASLVNAQISKGTILLGGNINFADYNISNSQGYKNNFFNAQPALGFTVKENKVIGFSLAYSHGVQNFSSTQTSKSNTYGAGLFLRKYMPLGKGFYLYGQAEANYYYSKTDQQNNSFQTQKISTVDLNVYPGVAYRVSKRFLLEIAMSDLISLNYSATKQDYTTPPPAYSTKSKQLRFNVNANPASNLSLGFRILLGS